MYRSTTVITQLSLFKCPTEVHKNKTQLPSARISLKFSLTAKYRQASAFLQPKKKQVIKDQQVIIFYLCIS